MEYSFEIEKFVQYIALGFCVCACAFARVSYGSSDSSMAEDVDSTENQPIECNLIATFWLVRTLNKNIIFESVHALRSTFPNAL